MFLESLLETSPLAKRRRGWATLTSFLTEAAVIGVVIVVPLARPEALPAAMHFAGSILSLPSSGPPPQPAGDRPLRNAGRKPPFVPDRVIRVPVDFPDHPYKPTAPEAPIEPTGVWDNPAPYIPGLQPGTGPGNRVLDHLVGKIPVKAPEAPPKAPVPVTSVITEGMLIHRVQPVYPQMAIITRTEGTVVLRAIIGRDGVIREMHVVSGPPLLIRAAADAVQQWRYRPYLLGGQSVEVETQVIVNFVLNR